MMAKAHTTLSVDPELLQLAKEERLVLSKIFDAALREALGATEKTDLKKFRLQRMAEIKTAELEDIKKELDDIGVQKIVVAESKSDKIMWDNDLIAKEDAAISAMSLEDFNRVINFRQKLLNGKLNKKLTFMEYKNKFEKLIKN